MTAFLPTTSSTWRQAIAAFAVLAAAAAAPAQQITSPEEHLGRPVGTDFELADWEEVSSWYWQIAEESPRVQTEVIGTTTEGRDFLLSVISSEENMARLDELKEYAAIIADPRGRTEEEKAQAVEDGRVILLISPQIHSTEAAGTEAAMQFIYLLVTSDEEPWASARENLVVGMFACTNPDGLDHVVHWYRENLGTPYEATGMLQLYQKYTGHDNNRDWFMLTQAETRIATEQLYSVWHPQVYWDIHQHGSRSSRFFVPPYRDPLNPNIDPAIVTGTNMIGSRAMLDMTRQGMTGISTGVTYDAWWTGGNRSTPARHNIIGILTEAASVDIATPLFLRPGDLNAPGHLRTYEPSNHFPVPWAGGWWRLSDIIDYKLAFGESLVGTLSRERTFWLQNALEAAERIIQQGRETGPRAWIIPSDNRDPDAVHRLVDVLLLSGIELHTAPEDFEADGRTYPSGSIVILRDQPYSAHVKDLFEVQRYPDSATPYDVAGWTLPHLLGVHRVEAMQPLDAEFDRVDSVEEAVATFEGSTFPAIPGWNAAAAHSGSWTEVFGRLSGGDSVQLATSGENAGQLITPAAGIADEDVLTADSLPRVGLYAPWAPSMDEGWMRWVFDTWEVPYVTVRNEQLRAGQLHDFLDVLIIPSIGARRLDEGRSPWSIPEEYARGLDPEGAAAIEEFVRTGGRLITLQSASNWAIDLLQLPVVDVTGESGNRSFSCPGSVLRAIPVTEEPLNSGLPHSISLFFSNSAAYRPMTADERQDERREDVEVTSLLKYASTRVLLSGWIREPQVIEGRDAWLHARYGEGEVHLFAFRPHYRAWSQGTFPLIFRAIVF